MSTAETPNEMDAVEPERGMDPIARDANLRVARSSWFDGYLTDEFDQPLYMFAGDVPGGTEAGCVGACAEEWPPFDIEIANLDAAIDPADVGRFHRQDGPWQTTYKGHPLYYRKAEAEKSDVTADGLDGRWFVARDYFTFLSTARTFAPEGAMGSNSPFLTDGYGRALYICLDDQPATETSSAVSSCDEACTRERPLFVASEGDQKAVLPSTLDARDFGELQRADGSTQLTYRGWPLYYFSGDLGAGATAGHNERAWRALDPNSFGLLPDSSD